LTAHNLQQLEQYANSNFGFDGFNYKPLTIGGNLQADTQQGDRLDIESPCSITVEPQSLLTGNFVSLDGRRGVLVHRGGVIDAGSTGTICILSEQGRAQVQRLSAMTAGALTVQGAQAARIRASSTLLVGDTRLVSERQATVERLTIVSGNLYMDAPLCRVGRGAQVLSLDTSACDRVVPPTITTTTLP
jgi:hypothetical protein